MLIVSSLLSWSCEGQEVPEGDSESVIEMVLTMSRLKTVGILIPSKWGCGGQEAPDGSPPRIGNGV